jgi:hypothetical protein
MRKIVLVFFIASIGLACKNEQKSSEKPVDIEQVKEKKKEFIVTMSFKTNKEDSFNLRLHNIVFDEFQTKNITITEKVSSSSGYDSLTANFGENISNSFSITFGNKEVKEIEIASMSISYGDKIIEVSPENVSNYFVFTKYISQDTISKKLVTKKIGNTHTPTIILKGRQLQNLQK